MNKTISSIIPVLFVLLFACEGNNNEINCLPQRVVKKIPQGSNVLAITADYKYENDRLDRIVWSNYQTDYYTYNSDSQVSKVSNKNVQSYEKLESWLTYDGGLLVRSDQYLIRLDRFTQEDSDTTFTGYRELEYEGNNPILEKVYLKNEETSETVLNEYKEYTYDLAGNIIKYVSLSDIDGDTIEAFSYSYDSFNNPSSSLHLFFNGQSYVNNILQSIDLLSGDTSNYQIGYSLTHFPEQIVIKLDAYITELINIDYVCQ